MIGWYSLKIQVFLPQQHIQQNFQEPKEVMVWCTGWVWFWIRSSITVLESKNSDFRLMSELCSFSVNLMHGAKSPSLFHADLCRSSPSCFSHILPLLLRLSYCHKCCSFYHWTPVFLLTCCFSHESKGKWSQVYLYLLTFSSSFECTLFVEHCDVWNEIVFLKEEFRCDSTFLCCKRLLKTYLLL